MTGDRLAAMLLRQAERRSAPDWVRGFLAGEGGATVEEAGDGRLVLTAEDGAVAEIEVRLLVPPRSPRGEAPWRPAGLELADEELGRLSYVVVDEIVDDAAVLSVSPWPAVDERGRLVFGDEPSLDVLASVEALLRYLRTRLEGSPPDSLRMGDAFAARVRTGRVAAGEGSLLPPSAWLAGSVHSIHAAAREQAKTAFYAAVAPTLRAAEAGRIRRTEPKR